MSHEYQSSSLVGLEELIDIHVGYKLKFHSREFHCPGQGERRQSHKMKWLELEVVERQVTKALENVDCI